MNMQNLMAQARKIQGDMEKITKEIENKEFEATNNVVKITGNGKYEIIKVEILDAGILTDKEILEDMISIVTNDLLKKIKTEKEEKLGKYTGGMGGLF